MTVKHRAPQHEQLESVLIQWFGQKRAQGALITDRLLVEKAKALAEKLLIDKFKASDGWLAGFKKRHSIKLQRPHGESGAADLEGVDVARIVIGQIITELGFKLEDVYNMDETGLYYRAKPSKTLAAGEPCAKDFVWLFRSTKSSWCISICTPCRFCSRRENAEGPHHRLCMCQCYWHRQAQACGHPHSSSVPGTLAEPGSLVSMWTTFPTKKLG